MRILNLGAKSLSDRSTSARVSATRATRTTAALPDKAKAKAALIAAGLAPKKRSGSRVQFVGPDRTALWQAAQVLAGELKARVKRVDLSAVVSRYIGETEKNLRKVFASAAAADAVLFFDEADALFGKRTEVKDAHDRYANQEVSYLLQRIEEYPGVVILATNGKTKLPPALLRRFPRIVKFPPPKKS
jgi:SpoVK/Ycf46/Vps4 family AAA+-type ATPase